MDCHVFKPNFVLIDFENVQPKNLSIVSDEQFQIRLFLGAKQTRLDMRVVDAMHEFGTQRAKYIRALESGKDALDFSLPIIWVRWWLKILRRISTLSRKIKASTRSSRIFKERMSKSIAAPA